MDYYEMLGVERDATPEEIKRAYRAKSMKMHPDVGGDSAEFAELSAAYKTLMNEDDRAFYDRTGNSPSNSLDLNSEAKTLLLGLFEAALENTMLYTGIDILDELYKQCRSRIQVRQRDIQFIGRTKQEFEDKLCCILKDGEEETIFDDLLKQKIQRCEEELALAEVDIQIIELALKILHDYHPNPEEKTRSERSKNKELNDMAKSLLESDEGLFISSLSYGQKDSDDE